MSPTVELTDETADWVRTMFKRARAEAFRESAQIVAAAAPKEIKYQLGPIMEALHKRAIEELDPKHEL